MDRRFFMRSAFLTGLTLVLRPAFASNVPYAHLSSINPLLDAVKDEDIFEYIIRVFGAFDVSKLGLILGSANEFKEGDALAGLAAADENSREIARSLISNTLISKFRAHPVFSDQQSRLINDTIKHDRSIEMTFAKLKQLLLDGDGDEIKAVANCLTSDEIAVVLKLMNNDELILVSNKVFNQLPGSKIGARGYMGARVQPNSPTDNPEDIFWQVMNAFSYGVGDVVLGTNPVSSDTDTVAKIESTLFDIIQTFKLSEVIPHCVLAHIDVQSEVEKNHPGTTGIWFQSIAGTDNANKTFDLSIEKLKNHLYGRYGKYGFYAETGQGADESNGHGSGFDMLLHESRKYGLLRALKHECLNKNNGSQWVFVNDVAGFIGPEVFRTKEQLVRCCLEDLVMGKLHGLTIGLDICTTLHMDVSLDDLDWCIDRILPANPAYLMALPTKNDPMLSYLTTSFSDHLRIREKFGYKVNDEMWDFFKTMGVIDQLDAPGVHFGDPSWVYYMYCKSKGDERSENDIRLEAKSAIERVRKRGVPISEGTGAAYWLPPAALDDSVRKLYADAKYCLWQPMDKSFLDQVPNCLMISSTSTDRVDYVYHPVSGESLSANSIAKLEEYRKSWKGRSPDIQIVISDGLNALSLSDKNHLLPFLQFLTEGLKSAGFHICKKNLFVEHGRVRAGYRAGEMLFGVQSQSNSNTEHVILHIIGERPGSEHRSFSVYITAASVAQWRVRNSIDHNITKVVSGISDTSFQPNMAAQEVVALCKKMLKKV